jgi:predicted RNase H-like nuclease (RuvC/YqgF family)
VFEMFKKPEPETEPVNDTTDETPTENIEETLNEALNDIEYITPENPEPCQATQDNSLSTLENLGREEQMLLEEKAQLINMETSLRQKITDEIEAKRHRIEDLKQEIPELRQTCDALAKALNVTVNQ